MALASCIVHCRPEHGQAVADRLHEIPGAEVHGGIAEGKLVVTLEDRPGRALADTLGALNTVPGVINTVLIYHYGGSDIASPPDDLPEHPALEDARDHHPS